MRKEKKNELLTAKWVMVILGVIVLIPAVVEFALVAYNWDQLEKKPLLFAFTAPALFVTQLVLLYFFRIAISNFQSIKAQTLQLDLREALCKFVQPYSDFTERTKRSDNPGLEKFESLIFSGIVSNDQQLPSTFDGLEQLTKLFQAAKGGKPAP